MQALTKQNVEKLKKAINEANEALEYLDTQNIEAKIIFSDSFNIRDNKMPPKLTVLKLVEHIDYLTTKEG